MSVPTVTITSDGRLMDPKYQLVSVDISLEVDRVPEAQLMLIDGESSRRKFAISNTDFFEPGKDVEIKLRIEGMTHDASVFRGPVVRHSVQAGQASSVLVVEVKDPAIKLTQARHSAVYRDLTDGEVISKLIRQAGLAAGSIPATHPMHAQLVQYQSSDWDFILARADVLGLVVVADKGTISLAAMSAAGATAVRLEYGMDEIHNFEIMVDSSRQPKGFESAGWDQKNQKATQPFRGNAVALQQGNIDAARVAASLGADTWRLAAPTPLYPGELQTWADARLARSRLSMIRGRLAIPGTARLKLMDVVDLAGIGDRFNGKALVTGVRHRVDEGGWQTDLQFGLSPDWYCRRDDIGDPPAAGLLPAVQGLCLGVVDQFEADTENEFRVRVLLPTWPATVRCSSGPVWPRPTQATAAAISSGPNRATRWWSASSTTTPASRSS